MALSKTKTLSNGETGNYWKITSFSVNKQAMTITYQLSLFVSQSYTTTSPIKGTTKTFTFPITKTQLAGDVIALGYTNILTKANTVVKAAVSAQAAIAADPTTSPPTRAKAAISAAPAVYGDADLQGATSD
jgi:hypothetical protein